LGMSISSQDVAQWKSCVTTFKSKRETREDATLPAFGRENRFPSDNHLDSHDTWRKKLPNAEQIFEILPECWLLELTALPFTDSARRKMLIKLFNLHSFRCLWNVYAFDALPRSDVVSVVNG
jgi:hypothetical protein